MTDLNLDALAQAIASTEDNASAAAADRIVARAQALALIDIAVSLRELGAFVNLQAGIVGEVDERPDDAAPGEPDLGPIDVGDWVVEDDDAGEDFDEAPVRVLAVDFREGETVIDIGNGFVWAALFRKVEPPVADPEPTKKAGKKKAPGGE